MAIVVAQVKTHWNGTSGGPGINHLAFQSQTDPHTWDASAAQQAVDAVRAFWNSLSGQLSNKISLTVDPAVDVFNIADAGLVGTYSAATAPAIVTGTDNGNFSMANGVKISLKTASIINRRRVHGAIFVVPTANYCFDSSGTVTPGAMTTMMNAANTLLNTSRTNNMGLCVWSKPKKATAKYPARDGQASDVQGFSINSHGATLRGRRD